MKNAAAFSGSRVTRSLYASVPGIPYCMVTSGLTVCHRNTEPPVGSAMPTMRPRSMTSIVGMMTLPPKASARAAMSSTSSTAMYVFHAVGTPAASMSGLICDAPPTVPPFFLNMR